jgi:rod shape-determining protein MreD
MGSYLSLPILALAVALQSGAAPQMRILGGVPDLVLLCVLAWSVHGHLEEGVTWAVVGGVLRDLLSAAPTGLSAVGLVIMVFVINRLSEQFYRVGLLLLIGFVVVATLISHTISYMLLFLTGTPLDLLSDLTFILVPTLAYNLIFMWPVYGALRWVQVRYAMDRRFFT